jgi:hypothetical protein
MAELIAGTVGVLAVETVWASATIKRVASVLEHLRDLGQYFIRLRIR